MTGRFRLLLGALTLLVSANAAPAQAAGPLITISIPVKLSDIDRAFDSFSVGCQLQSTGPLGQINTANMDGGLGKLVNRAFSGNVTVTYSGDAAFAAGASQAVCQLGLYSSTNPQLSYRPQTDDALGGIPDKYKAKPGTPLNAIIFIKL